MFEKFRTENEYVFGCKQKNWRKKIGSTLRLFDAPTLNGILDGDCCTIALEEHDSVLPLFLPYNTELVLN